MDPRTKAKPRWQRIDFITLSFAGMLEAALLACAIMAINEPSPGLSDAVPVQPPVEASGNRPGLGDTRAIAQVSDDGRITEVNVGGRILPFEEYENAVKSGALAVDYPILDFSALADVNRFLELSRTTNAKISVRLPAPPRKRRRKKISGATVRMRHGMSPRRFSAPCISSFNLQPL